MATIKSYTDISQSKTLSKILPLKSADMCYLSEESLVPKVIYNGMAFFDSKEERLTNIIHCWSLAALLDIIPKHIKDHNVLRIDISENDFAIWYGEIGFGVNNDLPDIIADNPIDACYDMIIHLNELKML